MYDVPVHPLISPHARPTARFAAHGGNPPRARAGRRRRGVAAALAMLYLVLFSTLAIGFFAAFTLSTQTAYNERDARRSLAAAESGMEFIRYQLWALNITYSSSPADLFNRVEAGLATRLNGTPDLNGGNIARVGDTLLIPGDADEFIDLDGTGEGFRAEITSDGTQLVVSTVGRTARATTSASQNRSIRLRYGVFQRPSSIFSFGVASRSPITFDSNSSITGSANPAHGSVLTTSYQTNTPIVLKGNASISGDVSLVNPNASVSVSSNAKIAGSRNATIQAQHTHKGVEEPEFPAVDTDAFKPFATNVLSVVGKKYDNTTLKNVYIKANTNPTFDGNSRIEGVIYIETPNQVTFSSNTEIVGAIVVQNNPTGTVATNSITFNSNVTLEGVDQLPATADFPAELRTLKGSMILAPKFLVHFNSNFGAAGGSIVAGKLDFDSNANGTIKGSVINLEDTAVHFDSNANITIENQGTSYQPSGLYFGSRYVPLPGSYEEVLP